jgi:hypothetical protein
LREEFIVGTYRGTQTIVETTQTTQQHVHEIGRRISAVGDGVLGLNDQYENLGLILAELTQKQQYILDAIDGRNAAFRFLKDELQSEDGAIQTNGMIC